MSDFFGLSHQMAKPEINIIHGTDETAYSKGLLPSQVINLGGDNR